MSCEVTCLVNSGNKMIWSVKQCMKGIFIKNKRLIFFRGFRTPAKTPRSCGTLINITRCTIKEGSQFSREFWRSDIVLKNHSITYFNGGLCSNKPTDKRDDKQKIVEKKLSFYQKFKNMYKEYWYIVLPVHIITSTFWFGGFYYLAVCGIDIPALLQSLGAPNSWVDSLQDSKAGNMFFAYTLYKVATPIRYTVTLGGTTISINYLKKWGWIKPMPNKEQIKKIYKEQTGVFKDFKTSCHDKMQVTKDEFLKTKKEMTQHYIEAKEGFHKSVKETRNNINENVKSASYDWKLIFGWCMKGVKGDQNSFGGKK